MTVELSKSALESLGHQDFAKYRGHYEGIRNRNLKATVSLEALSLEAIRQLENYAKTSKDRNLSRAIKVFLAARAGDFSHPIPKLAAAEGVFRQYLLADRIDGWIYVTDASGNVNPELVTSIETRAGEGNYDKRPFLSLRTVRVGGVSSQNSNRASYQVDTIHNRHNFYAEDVTNKTVTAALDAAGIQKETADLKASYEAVMKRHIDEIMPTFAEQFRFTGKPVMSEVGYGRVSAAVARRVINDLQESDYAPLIAYYPISSSVFRDGDTPDGDHPDTGLIPYHPVIKVFDLKTYDTYWVHSMDIQPYVYDSSLADKIVLPATHRDLLDVLTTDLSSFTGDMIEGKSTGNVILCTGITGVGKTLTAEVYAELMRRPLYSIHSGNLGTSASEIQKNLETVFRRAKRWDCVLLLDEADVFVMERGNSVEQNAIVAEFLRTLEYTDCLMFMTTNRHDDIDDAIMSRCLAIIRYKAPERDDAFSIWKIISSELGTALSDDLVRQLVDQFPDASGRDMKQLCGTVFRMEKAGRWTLDAEAFRRAAMFRGVKMSSGGSKGSVDGVDNPEIAGLISAAQDRIETSMGFRPTVADTLRHLMMREHDLTANAKG
jgi:hypothetical protein